MPTNPLATFRYMVAVAADMKLGDPAELDDPDKSRVIAGDAPEIMPEPWAQIRGAGGPQGDKQCPEDYQRFDVNVYSQNQMEADLISRQIFRAMRGQGQKTFTQDFDDPDTGMTTHYETCVISVDAEGGPFQLVDTDRRVPFTFRSYVLFYGEDL